jgi:hypothetical protein
MFSSACDPGSHDTLGIKRSEGLLSAKSVAQAPLQHRGRCTQNRLASTSWPPAGVGALRVILSLPNSLSTLKFFCARTIAARGLIRDMRAWSKGYFADGRRIEFFVGTDGPVAHPVDQMLAHFASRTPISWHWPAHAAGSGVRRRPGARRCIGERRRTKNKIRTATHRENPARPEGVAWCQEN